jgi:hypothetical protein
MKVLLDEQLNRKIKPMFLNCEVFTIEEMGWLGLKNGQLREELNNAGFDVLITADKNIPFQQNLTKVIFSIFLLDIPNLAIASQIDFLPKLNEFLQNPPKPMPKIVIFSVENLSIGLGRKEKELVKSAGVEDVLFY